jgi:hypothetical protein
VKRIARFTPKGFAAANRSSNAKSKKSKDNPMTQEPRTIQERFERVNEARRKAVTEKKPTFVDKIVDRDQQRNSWTSPGRTGTHVDPAVVQARQAWETEKAEAKKPAETVQAPRLSPDEEGILARAWANSNPSWYASSFNVDTFCKVMAAFNLPKTFAGFNAAFKYCQEHNHLEPRRRHRGQTAPVPFTFVAPKPQAASTPTHAGRTPVRIVQTISPEENQRLRTMPLSELRDAARQDMRAYNADKKEN